MKEDGSSTLSLVQTAGRKLKFRSSLMAADPFTVRNVIGSIGREDIRRRMRRNTENGFFFFLHKIFSSLLLNSSKKSM